MDDFKEIVYFTIGLFMAAFIITLVSALGRTARQMADVRSSELQAMESVKSSRKYSLFNNQVVTGGDVIACLRENAISGELQIYVNMNAYGASMSMNEGNYMNAEWKLIQLMKSIQADFTYKAILVYDYDNPATAAYLPEAKGTVTGIQFIYTTNG